MDKLNELLIKSFDQELTPEERRAIDDALENSDELRKEKVSTEKMREMMASSSYSFSDSFVGNTIERAQQDQLDSLQVNQFVSIFKRIAFSGAAAIIAFLIAIYFIDGSLTIDTLFGIADYSPEIAELSFFDFQEIE